MVFPPVGQKIYFTFGNSVLLKIKYFLGRIVFFRSVERQISESKGQICFLGSKRSAKDDNKS